MRPLLLFLLPICMMLVSCGKKSATPSTSPHATVILRDGSSYSGRVVASTPEMITLIGDDNQTRMLNMPNVKSIEYWDTPAAQAQTQPGQPAPGQPGPSMPGQPPPEEPHPEHYHPDLSAVHTKTHVVPAGTRISVRTEETIDSRHAVEGQTYAGEVTRDVLDAEGAVVIPHGSNAQIIIRSASGGGHIKGRSDLVMDLASVSIGGQRYKLQTNNVVRTGKQGVGANRRTAKFAGSGAAIGAVIGALAGHGKGAAIGAASGAGAGLAGQILTKGPAVRVPVESILTFRLEEALRVTSADTGE